MRMKPSTILPQNGRTTYLLRRPLRNAGKPTVKHSRYFTVSKVTIVWIVVLAFTLPIFRSGLKTNLSFVEWLRNHTVFGDAVQFIPKEDYDSAFRGE